MYIRTHIRIISKTCVDTSLTYNMDGIILGMMKGVNPHFIHKTDANSPFTRQINQTTGDLCSLQITLYVQSLISI